MCRTMYHKIDELASAALLLQNKNAMEEALREIGGIAKNSWQEQDHVDSQFDVSGLGAARNETVPAASGDTVRVTGVSDGDGNERVLSVKVTPARKGAK